MLKIIWTHFETGIVRNAFRGSGYFFEEGVDFSKETASESDSEE